MSLHHHTPTTAAAPAASDLVGEHARFMSADITSVGASAGMRSTVNTILGFTGPAVASSVVAASAALLGGLDVPTMVGAAALATVPGALLGGNKSRS